MPLYLANARHFTLLGSCKSIILSGKRQPILYEGAITCNRDFTNTFFLTTLTACFFNGKDSCRFSNHYKTQQSLASTGYNLFQAQIW